MDGLGWHAIMDGLAAVTSINSLNGVQGLNELFGGGQTEVILQNKALQANEAVVAVVLRSSSTVTKLDLRSPCCVRRRAETQEKLGN